MAHLTLSLLGSPQVERDGVPIEVDTRKAIALLAYLCVSGRRQSRDTLATLLWPDYDGEHARAALRRTLSTLRRALAGGWLEVDRTTVGINLTGARLDVAEFRRLLEQDRLAEAVELYGGDFLAGFGLRDSVEFDDWQFFQAEELRRELAGALEKLARRLGAQGGYEQAIRYARRWLALDPLHEPAHRTLMQLYAWSGQRAAGLRQYRECVRTLSQELGVAPLEETTALDRAIKEDRVPPPEPVTSSIPSATATAPAARPPAYPLVGRSAEWQALLDAYSESTLDGRLVVLTGEAGIGKTRLAEELLAHARAQGAAVIATRCSEGEAGLAYGLIVDLLRAALSRSDTPGWLAGLPAQSVTEAARLLPDLAGLVADVPPATALDSPGAQSRFLEGLCQVLGAAGRVLFVDDVHWADEASIDALAYLVRRLEGHPLFVLVAWRPAEVPAEHSLRRLVDEARRSGRSVVVTPSRLSLEDVADLARAASPESGRELAARLYEETGGLPLFVVEYLAAIGDAGTPDWSLPGGVAELLRSRIARVGETARQVLTTAAVIGRPFDVDTVREASGRPDEEVVAALEELTGASLLQEATDGYDFGHERVRALVYGETSLARRRLLHRRVAQALVARSRRNVTAQAAFIAEHYRLSGQESDAAEYFRLAGEHARGLYANAEAQAHFRSALALGHPDAAALHEAIGDSHTLLGEYGAALASYETAAALAGPERLPTVEHKLGGVHHRRGDWELADSHFAAALAVLDEPAEPARSARIYADRSLTAHRRGEEGAAFEWARHALGLAEAEGDTQALARAHNMLGVLASSRDDLCGAREHLERSLALAEGSGEPGARVAALNNLALACRAGGDLDRALVLTESALALCASQGDRHREAALHNNLADALHAAGRSEDAMSHLKQAVAIFAEIGAEAGGLEPEIWKLVEW